MTKAKTKQAPPAQPAQFDYLQWLAALKVGDEVIALRKTRVIAGVTDDEIIIECGDNMYYFCRKTGREKGSRAGHYKDGTLKPYTDEMRAAEHQERLKRQKEDAKSNLVSEVAKELANNCKAYFGCMASELSKEPLQRLNRIHQALIEINKKKYEHEDWELPKNGRIC